MIRLQQELLSDVLMPPLRRTQSWSAGDKLVTNQAAVEDLELLKRAFQDWSWKAGRVPLQCDVECFQLRCMSKVSI